MNDKKSDLIRSNIDTIIIQSLSEGNKYNYEIAKEIEERCNGKLKLKQSTLNSCLEHLEEQKLITSYLDSKNSSGTEKKYFSITELGQYQLSENKNNVENVKQILDMLINDSEDKLDDINDIDNINKNINYSRYSPISKNFLNEKNEKEEFLKTQEITSYPDDAIDISILNTTRNRTSAFKSNLTDTFDETPVKDYKKIISSLVQNNANPIIPTISVENADKNVDALSNTAIKDAIDKETSVREIKDYDEIKNELLIKGIKLKPYQEDTRYMKLGMLLKRKLALFNSLIFIAFIVLDLLSFYLICDNVCQFGIAPYITIFSVSLIPSIVTLVAFLRKPNYKERDRLNFKKTFSFSVLGFLWIVAITTVICFVSNVNFGNQAQLYSYLLFPSILSLNIPLLVISHRLLRFSGFFYEKK